MKQQLFIPLLIAALILSAVFFPGCSGNNKREPDKSVARIKDPNLPAEQRSMLLAEMGSKVLQDTSDTKLLLNYASLLSSAGFTSAGLKIYRDMLRSHPSDMELRTLLRNAELQSFLLPRDTDAFPLSKDQADYIKALNTIRLLNEKIGASPADPALYEQRGNHLLVIGQESAGIWDLKKSLALDPCFPDALFSLAVVEMRKEKNRESLHTLVQLENCIQGNDIIPRRSWLDFKVFLQTIIETDSLIRQHPDLPDYYMQKARIYVQGKEYELAIATLCEALKTSPENAEIYAFRAYVNYTAGKQEDALHDLAEAERLTGKSDSELSKMIRSKKFQH
jgi:tetratricopeptide (TPR) repeat protein